MYCNIKAFLLVSLCIEMELGTRTDLNYGMYLNPKRRNGTLIPV